LETQIKWPNDAVIRDRKVGGILVEMVENAVIVGIGANLNVPAEAILEPDYPATTVQDELGRACDPEAVTAAVLNALGELYDDLRAKPDALNDRWRELSSIVDRNVTVETESETLAGTVTGFSDDGRLLLREADGLERAILAGRVRLPKPGSG
jgi:BirA family biotin operon repressor/biotin-[acetyl-CoA-carboxylase] ligase